MNPVERIAEQIEEEGLWKPEVTLKRNVFLHQAGDVCSDVYQLLEGSMRVFIMDEGEEQTIRLIYGNDLFAVLDSHISGQPTTFYVQALKKTRLRAVGHAAYTRLIERSSENKTLWNTLLTAMVYQQLERETDILTTSPKARYERVLKRSPRLFQEIPHKYIASYLRMTPETLSRLKKS